MGAPAWASAQNIVTNPGFESGTSGWSARGTESIAVAGAAHSGAACLRSYNRTQTWHGVRQSVLGVLQPGRFYLCEAWVRTSNPSAESVQMSFQQTIGGVTTYPWVGSAQASSTGWVRISGTFAFEDGVAPSVLNLIFSGPSAGTEIFVDDVSVATFDLGAPENLLENPGFESGIAGWNAHGPATLTNAGFAHSGAGAALATGRAAAWNGVEQDLVATMQVGRTYFASAWVRTDAATNQTVKLTFQRIEGGVSFFSGVATGQASSNGWTWLSGYYTPQTTGEVTAIKFFVEGPAPGTGLYVDDAYVAPAAGLRLAAANYPGVRLGAGGTSYRDVRTGPALTAAFAGNFHLFSPGNALKFQATEPSENSFAYAEADALLDFGQARGGGSRGHVFVWHGGLPAWVTNVSRAPSEMQGILWNHIDNVAAHFRDRLPWWDVVNEAMDGANLRSTPWYDSPGIGYATNGTRYIAECFARARAADGDARLFYNDFGIEYVNPKSSAVHAMLSNLVASGVPVDGLGIQAHIDDGGLSIDTASMRSNLQRFQDLGLDLHITELDVRLPVDTNGIASAAKLAEQGDTYFDLCGTALGFPALKVMQTWGIYDGNSWIPAHDPGTGQALPFDFDIDKKPAYWGIWNALAGQAEKLAVAATSSNDTQAIASDAALRAGASRRFTANGDGDFISLRMHVPFRGSWNLRAGIYETSDSGSYRLSVGPPGGTPADVGIAFDAHRSAPQLTAFDIGNFEVATAGDHEFRFTCVGKNTSSSGRHLTIDYIRLTPLDCEPRFAQPPGDRSIAVNSVLPSTLFIAEDDTACGSLAVAAASSDQSLVPDAGIAIGGGSPYYTIAIVPAPDRAGTADITLVASDGARAATNAFVLTIGTPAEAWRTTHFGTALADGPTADAADPEGDGIPNGIEWPLGGNPLQRDAASLWGADWTGDDVVVSFGRIDASESSATLIVQWSTDLATWNDIPVGTGNSGPDPNGAVVSIDENGPDPDAVTVSLPRANGPAGRLFVRLMAVGR